MHAALASLQPVPASRRRQRRLLRAVLATVMGLTSFSPAFAAEASSQTSPQQERALERAQGVTGAVRRSTGALPAKPSADEAKMMVEGGAVRGPRGYERFCRLDPRYCAPPTKRRPGAKVAVSRRMVQKLEAFNRSVNAEFAPANDRDVYGVSDHWTFPSRRADCEDYVLEKQARLLKAGWPREALLIGVVVGEESPFHAVLIVRTTGGELVLDNMTDEVREWRETGYQWVIRQSTRYPERWVRILSEDAAAEAR